MNAYLTYDRIEDRRWVEQQLIVYRLTAAECESEIVRLRARRKDFLELVADTKRRILELE